MDPKLNSLYSEYLTKQSQEFDVRTLCFDKQLEFILDKAPFKTACCSRRAGKTVADAAYLISSALSRPRVVCPYITLTRGTAKSLIWPELREINRQYKLGGVPNEAELTITFPNGSVIRLHGANNEREIEKLRGHAIYLCVIDECQSFRSYFQKLIDEIISKALFDYGGTLALTGTPGPVPSGYFHDVCHSPEYSHFHWTFFDNPWIQKKSGQTPQSLLERELKRKGVGVDDPTIQRECFGKWSIDLNALVFKYDPVRNHYSDDPSTLSLTDYVIGVDIGYDDADAISVIGWSTGSPTAYLVHERIERKQGITELAMSIGRLAELYKPIRIVMDTGGLGKKIAEEITKRYQIPISAAEKARKFEFIEILNDAMRIGHFMAKKESQFAQDCNMVEWDRDAQQLKIKDSFHSDACDSTAYAYREALHWMFEPSQEKIVLNSTAWYESEVKKMEEIAEESYGKTLSEGDPLAINEDW